MYLEVLVSRFTEAFAKPRQSARRILDAKPSLSDALTMALAGMVVGVILSLIAALIIGAPQAQSDQADPVDRQPIVVLLFMVALFAIARFFIVSWMAHLIGRRAGGRATLQECYAVVGWCLLAISPVTLVFELGAAAVQQSASPLAAVVLLGATGYVLYMFAAFISEAHGFKNTAQVMAAIIGVAFLAAFVITLVLQMAGVRMET